MLAWRFELAISLRLQAFQHIVCFEDIMKSMKLFNIVTLLLPFLSIAVGPTVPGDDCTPNVTEYCPKGYDCHLFSPPSTFKCWKKVGFGVFCSFGQHAYCDADSQTCDNTCKYKIGETCSSNDECLSGASCTDKKCTCDAPRVPLKKITPDKNVDNTECQTAMGDKCDVDGECIDNLGDNAVCSLPDYKCACDTDYTADKVKSICVFSGTGLANNKAACDQEPADKNKKCEAKNVCQSSVCKKYEGEECSESDECLANSACTSKKCTCDSGFKPKQDKSACEKSGAAGVAASLLLVLFALMTSRVF